MPFDNMPDHNINTDAPLPDGREWRRVLIRAAQIVREGWCQGALEDDRDRVCASGAIKRAAGCPMDTWSVLALEAANRLGAAIKSDYGSLYVPDWNDMEGRTAGDVASTMEEAARMEASDG